MQSESDGNSSKETFLQTQFGMSGSEASKYLKKLQYILFRLTS